MKNIEYLSPEELRKYKVKKVFSAILKYVFLIGFAIFILVPFYWMLIGSVKGDYETFQIMTPTFFPRYGFYFSNYAEVFRVVPNFARYFGNTLIVGFFTTVGTLITTILAAFAFSRLRFKGRDLIFGIMLMTMMIPGEMLIITNFINVSRWGWINTYVVLILPFTASVFYTYFMRQAFLQIPNELYYAAKVDGVSDFKYLTRVMLPMAKATVTTVTILGMMGAWNAFIWPNLVTRADNMRLVTNGIMEAFKSETATLINLQMAATMMVTVPILVAFLVFKKYIMRGVSRSGIKG